MLTSIVKVVILGVILLGFGYFLMYSKKILSFIMSKKDNISRTYSKHVGKHVRKANIKVVRRAELNHDTLYYKCYKFLDDLIRDLDMVKDGETGFLYRFEEIPLLAKRVCELFADGDLCNLLSGQERVVAAKRHERTANAEALINIYKEVALC